VSWTLRPAVPADADAIARRMGDSFRDYSAFAPPGWEPPSAEDELGHLRERLGQPDVWCLVAEADGDQVGHVAILPAAIATRVSDEPGLAHLLGLFVRPSHWGTGLATELHGRALSEAAARGFSSIRLFAAAGQTRARRFYEREGWAAVSEPFEDPDFGFGLALVEYRRPLGPP
jgi:GNAT superfamily N-acetyltransferase